MSPYAKAYVAGITALIAALNVIYNAIAHGRVTAKDYVAAVIALLTVLGVYAIKNEPVRDKNIMRQPGLGSDPGTKHLPS